MVNAMKAEGKGVVIMTHRPTAISACDRLLVLDHGRVVGQGTHDELIRDVPLYRDLAARQLLA